MEIPGQYRTPCTSKEKEAGQLMELIEFMLRLFPSCGRSEANSAWVELTSIQFHVLANLINNKSSEASRSANSYGPRPRHHSQFKEGSTSGEDRKTDEFD
jgi:hypothetical protein